MQTKLVKRLHDKKQRTESGLFLVEGEKSVLELLHSDFEIVEIYITADIFEQHRTLIEKTGTKYYVIDTAEIASLSTLENNQSVLALVKQKPAMLNTDLPVAHAGISLILDGIRDPGNLGTLIRIADWYGLTHIIASTDTAEFYNPKTIAASMGSFTRIQCLYTDLPALLHDRFANTPIIVADIAGISTDKFSFPTSGALIIGSESHGARQEIRSLATNTVTIKKYGQAESLNAAVAAGIILDHWKQSLSS